MKKLLLTLVAISISASMSLSAKSTTLVGGGLGYGTGIENVAIQLGAIFETDWPVDIAPDFKYYLVSSDVEDVSVSAWEINANAHYTFINNKNIRVFGLGGLQYANYSTSYSGPGAEFLNNFAGGSYGRIGLNLGGGVDFDLDGFHLVPELKFTVGGNEQLFIGVSAMFPV